MIRFSIQKLRSHGFTNIKSFRAGGWQANSKVLEVLIEEGFESDSSPVPVEKVKSLYPNTPLAQNVADIWEGITPNSQPYLHANSKFVLIPNNAGLADYADSDSVIRDLTRSINENSVINDSIHLVYGFHFETGHEYLERVEQTIYKLERLANTSSLNYQTTIFRQNLGGIRDRLKKRACLDRLFQLIP